MSVENKQGKKLYTKIELELARAAVECGLNAKRFVRKAEGLGMELPSLEEAQNYIDLVRMDIAYGGPPFIPDRRYLRLCNKVIAASGVEGDSLEKLEEYINKRVEVIE